jgi:hypothetical protein
MTPVHTIITQQRYIPQLKMDAVSLDVPVKSTSTKNAANTHPKKPVISPITITNIVESMTFIIPLLLPSYFCILIVIPGLSWFYY